MSTAAPQVKNQEERNSKSVYLIDGSGYIYRAYHAIRGLSNSKGFPTNAVYRLHAHADEITGRAVTAVDRHVFRC